MKTTKTIRTMPTAETSPEQGQLTIAVTALNATDNPGPGVAVIRSLREAMPHIRVVGLTYDTLDSGIYSAGLVDDVFLIPYPSQGIAALQARLHYIHERVGGIDVLLPTLDSELAAFISLQPQLQQWGIRTFLPTRAQLDMRSKVNLADLGEDAGIAVPPQLVIDSISTLYQIHQQLSFPLLIKGVFYGATIARSVDEAVKAFHEITAQWGYPVIAQTFVAGDEVCVVAVGDGDGGTVGALPMKKTYITDKGKGWAGIAIKDPRLIELARKFMAATHWRGPCELEVIRPQGGDQYYLLEVNPRFPAWCYLSAGAGMNLPHAVVRLAVGETVEQMTDYKVGTMFVRIAVDQIATLEDLQKISEHGERLLVPRELPSEKERAA